VIERAVYQPYGEQTESLTSPVTPETKGWIGERYDTDAGLQYLNARYYDPVLGLFAQPDWFEVMQPGVGTNRYGYAFGDPVNARDPGGNAAVYSDTDGDGDNEYSGQINPGDPGYGDDFSKSGIQASEWVAYNNAASGNISVNEAGGGNGPFIQIGPGNTLVEALYVQNEFILKSANLVNIIGSAEFYGFAVDLLEAGNYLASDINDIRERGGYIYVKTSSGQIRYVGLPLQPGATFNSTPLPGPSPRRGEIAVSIHIHPATGIRYRDEYGALRAGAGYPSSGDITHATTYGIEGLIVTGKGGLWGYNGQGY
jgi:RHS repeat-associated protein